jgi:hypothetical protein
VTGWRALRAALRGRVSVAQVGIEPTASLVLSQGGLPVAYRAMRVQCPEQESNLQTLGFKPSRSADWRIRARVIPDGLEPPLPGCRPGVVAAGPRDYSFRSGSRKARTHNCVIRTCFRDRFLIRPDDFRKVPGVGIEPTPSWFRARRHYQQQLPRIISALATRAARRGSRSSSGSRT